jgi:hypothetical protein
MSTIREGDCTRVNLAPGFKSPESSVLSFGFIENRLKGEGVHKLISRVVPVNDRQAERQTDEETSNSIEQSRSRVERRIKRWLDHWHKVQ